MIVDLSAIMAILLNEAESAEPLLFKGDDFGHTDIEPAL